MFVAQESGRELGELPEEPAPSRHLDRGHGAAVITQDEAFSSFDEVNVLRV